ncbi:MAG: glutamine--fructose-6-phosphate transaminase (isomerizing) [Desulfurococcaceae archaeon TW002]
MGGIFGIVCVSQIPAGVMREGLKRLTYRGFDGTGLAYLDETGNIIIRKSPKPLNEALKDINLDEIPASIALGHVRYANRGRPVYENTHPLTDCRNEIVVVGDGVIENFEEFKEVLEKKGHVFVSRTDTEVFAHLVEDFMKEGGNLLEAIARATRELRGVYSIALLIRGTQKIYVVNNEQSIMIGKGDKCYYISSDIPSLYGFSEDALLLGDDTLAEVGSDVVRVFDVKTLSEVKELTRKRIKYSPGTFEKAGYPHYMLKEIYEIPEALVKTTYTLMDKYLRLASMVIYGAKNTYVIGTGTSLHAGLVSAYYFSEMSDIFVNVISAAEFPYYALDNISTGTVIIAISQSGETSDVIKSIRLAKQRGAVVVGITNVVGSRLSLESNVYLPIGAGPEIAVPATKTFTSTLATLAILATYTGLHTGLAEKKDLENLYDKLRNFAKDLSSRLPLIDNNVSAIADELIGWESVYVSSSGINYPIALEGALKLKETALIHAEGLQLGEVRHGPMVLIKEGYPIILIKPVEETALDLYNKVAKEALSKEAKVITITSDREGIGNLIDVPHVDKELSPIATVVALQLLSYRLGSKLGKPIDTPPGLVKALTI